MPQAVSPFFHSSQILNAEDKKQIRLDLFLDEYYDIIENDKYTCDTDTNCRIFLLQTSHRVRGTQNHGQFYLGTGTGQKSFVKKFLYEVGIC